MAHTITPNDNAQLDTAQYKFGTASGLFDGTSDYLTVPDNADFNFASGDFAIDFWVRVSSLPGAGSRYGLFWHPTTEDLRLAGCWIQSDGVIYVAVRDDTGTLICYLASSDSSVAIATDTWTHIAFTRSGSTWRLFIQGNQVSVTTNTTAYPDFTGDFYIARYQTSSTSYTLNGWMDEFRVSKGSARWTSNFSVPTAAYNSDSYTVLLAHFDGVDASTTFTDSSDDCTVSASPLSLSLTRVPIAGVGSDANRTVHVPCQSLSLSLKTSTLNIHNLLGSTYAIEHRDKNGNLLRYLHPYAKSVSWEWKRKGGCGACRIMLAVPYRSIDFNVMDDIRIRVEEGTDSKLVYRGFVSTVSPALGSDETISLDVNGYSKLLDTIVIQNGGLKKTYSSQYVYQVINNILSDYIEAGSNINGGTVDTDTFTIDTIEFKVKVSSALETLANLLGNIEYGVDENLEFYWRQESEVLRHKFFVGYDIEKFTRTKDFSEFINKVFFEGGELVGGGTYVKTATNSGSISTYYLAEGILVNSSITTDTVADAYLTAMLSEDSAPKYKMSFRVPNTALRFEDTVPLGKVSVYDNDYDEGSAVRGIWGTTANGGSNYKWGRTANGGDNILWGGGGGFYQQQIETVKYTLSETSGRFNIDVSTGGTTNKFATQVRQLELLTENLRQK